MASNNNQTEEYYLRYLRLSSGDEIIAAVNHSGHFADFPKVIEICNPLKFDQVENPYTHNVAFTFYDWIPCTDFKNIKIMSSDIIAITTLAKDMKELYREAVKQTELIRDEWRDATPEKKIKNTKTALQDLLSVLPDGSADLMDTLFGDDAYDDNDIVKSMMQKKKSTVH